MTEYAKFRSLTDELYRYCTLTEKLTVYVQHKPAAAVPFLEEMIRELYQEDVKKKDEQDPGRP